MQGEHQTNFRPRLRKLRLALIAVGALAPAAGVAYATSAPPARLAATSVIQACQTPSSGNLRLLVHRQATCTAQETRVSWSVVANGGIGGTQNDPAAGAPAGDLGPMR